MTPNEIRSEIMLKGLSLTRIAAKAKCTLPEISMCISGARIYPEIRRVIARQLGRKVAEVFAEHHPQPRRRTSWCKAA
jgi:lambda repressor-like predicted transcriptional regulator